MPILQIAKTNIRWGSGDDEDDPEYSEDIEGEFYYIKFGSTTERGKFVAGSMVHSSLQDAISEAEKATNFTVNWGK